MTTEQATSSASDFMLGPTLHALYRLRHQHAHRTAREAAIDLVEKTISARLPERSVHAQLQGPPDKLRLVVELKPAAVTAVRRSTHVFNIPWRGDIA